MEEECFLSEKQSIRESAHSLKKYGSTCNHVRIEYLIRHDLDKTDTLQGIALKYGCTTEQIRRINRLFAQDSLFLKPFLMIPVEKNSPFYPKDRRPQSLPARASSIAPCSTTKFQPNVNCNDNNNNNNSKSMDSISTLSPEEENKRDIDDFLCKIDSTIAETRKYVQNSQKNIDFITSDDQVDGIGEHHRQRIYSLQASSSGTSLSQHTRNNSAGSSSQNNNSDTQLLVMTQGRRVQNSLHRLEQQQDEFFEL